MFDVTIWKTTSECKWINFFKWFLLFVASSSSCSSLKLHVKCCRTPKPDQWSRSLVIAEWINKHQNIWSCFSCYSRHSLKWRSFFKCLIYCISFRVVHILQSLQPIPNTIITCELLFLQISLQSFHMISSFYTFSVFSAKQTQEWCCSTIDRK